MQEKNMGHICPIGRSGVKSNYYTKVKHKVITNNYYCTKVKHKVIITKHIIT